MADFEDITGWREELAAFEKTEEGRTFFAGNKRYGGIKVPYENVVQMVELIRGDEELHEALRKKIWFAAYAEKHDLEVHDDEFVELNPLEAHDTFIAFERWYLMKAPVRFDKRDMIVATWLAIDLEEGRLTSLRTEQARDFIKENYARYISFPGGGGLMEKIVAIDASEISPIMKNFGLEGLIATAKRAERALEQLVNI